MTEGRNGVGHSTWPASLDEDDQVVAAFVRQARADGAPHHLGRYDHGVYEFAVGRLDDPSRHPLYRGVEEQLAFAMSALDGELSEARTGRLIRMVVHAERGALYAVSVTPRNYVLGIVFGRASAPAGGPPLSLARVALVREADRATCRLADVLRDQIGLPPQNPGGWDTFDEVLAEPERPLPGLVRRERDGALVGRLEDALHPVGLVYLAYCRDGVLLESADLIEHEQVARGRSARVPAMAVRAFYDRLAEDLGGHARQLAQTSAQAVPGRVLRIVLDVEQGAVYHYRLSPTEYLVGVAVHQAHVCQADEVLGDLVQALFAESRA
ncbi:hypothetical protein DZF91_35500 [Actinomadura logoneensis]|uniref:Uncharacterized protein n=1 Tax=Actinomadura logoneensis TaxID=2293572 RepID=A0A372JAC9_9ACTN|nr:hypothetical protein [Actinomadura logoneensis]RFU36947.1 hypothetical protein DZF91_35500 [Actinomadura logoneensis]